MGWLWDHDGGGGHRRCRREVVVVEESLWLRSCSGGG